MSLVMVSDCGRTARGDSSGTALSFVTVKEMPRLDAVKQTLSKDCCKYLLRFFFLVLCSFITGVAFFGVRRWTSNHLLLS